jgi:cyclophilin family peptidyl-prolyl cis-trans isomerase
MPQEWKTPPDMEIDPSKEYTATITTDKGDMQFRLFAEKAPKTVNNFVFLARQGYYDGSVFHRVINDFMAQGGDPSGTGMGGPGYQFEDEFHPDLRHSKRGILSMANAGPNTNGSQFFITHVATSHLDDKHSVFGELIAGEDVLMAIPTRDPREKDAPAGKLVSISIQES